MMREQTAFTLLSPNLSVYLGSSLFPTDPFLQTPFLAVAPALHALVTPLLSSSADPNVKTFFKPPFH